MNEKLKQKRLINIDQPLLFCSEGGNRTRDLWVMNPTL